MAVPSHLQAIVRQVLASPVGPPLSPWRQVGAYGIGGLTDVGFGRQSDLLLVISVSGRGVFDCITGARVARDASMPGDPAGVWHDRFHLEAEGIGPLAEQRVRTAGLYGGGLPQFTRDGWTVERLAPDWPEECLLLLAPSADIYNPAGRQAFAKLAVERAVRAWGFSPTGLSLVLATTSDLTLWGRCARG